MDFDESLEPWIFDTVLFEKQRQLAANPANATSPSTKTVNYTKKRFIQILSFGGDSRPPFKRLSISDSSTKIFAKLDSSAIEALQRGTGTKPPSRTEGAVCELTHYSLIFDPRTADGVIVDIHKLLYKGGACMSPIGEPQRLSEQEISSHLVRAMSSPMLKGTAGVDDEPMSSQVLSQAELLSDEDEIGSQEEDIATQVPRTNDARKRILNPEGGAMAQVDLMRALESFHERQTTSKRPSPSSGASLSPERASKRQHIEQNQKLTPSPARSFEPHQNSFPKEEVASEQKAHLDTTVRGNSTSKIDLPLQKPKVARSKLPAVGSRNGNDRHNKAVSDNFHIGLRSLSRKFISPPKLQLQYLSSSARYVDPRRPNELRVGVPPHILLELSTFRPAPQSDRQSAAEINITQPPQDEDVEMEDGESIRIISHGSQHNPQASCSPPKLKRYEEEAQEIEAKHSDDDDDDVAVPWSPSVYGSPGRDHAPSPMRSTSFGPSPVESQEEYFGQPADGEEDVVEEEEEPEDSPIRLPTPQPTSLLNAKPIRSSHADAPHLMGQIPSSSLSIDYGLEQEVPVALPSSSARLRTQSRSPTPVPRLAAVRSSSSHESRSPTPVPRINALTAVRSPVLQIERSPGGPEMDRRIGVSLFRTTVTRDGGETSNPDTRAMSSDPVIPATCVDSQETIIQNTASQETVHEAPLRPIISTARADRILVPATLPGRANAASHRLQVVNYRNSDDHVVLGTAGVVASQSSYSSVLAEDGSAVDSVVRHGPTGREAGPSLPLKDEPNMTRSSSSGKRPDEAQPRALEFKMLSPSANARDIASRTTLLPQPAERGARPTQDATSATTTASGLERTTRHVTSSDLKTIIDGQSRRSISTVASDAAEIDSRPKENRKLIKHSSPNVLRTALELPADTTADSLDSPGADIFGRFKLEYPQFEHHRSNFVMACTYIKWLLSNRKVMPVHQFLWDDFIRVFCGPYTHHVKSMKDDDGHTESPVDFYNKEVASPVFHSNVINQKTLPLALSSDLDLTRKHSQRLRRISSNFVLQSAATTPQEKRTHEAKTMSPAPAIAEKTVVEGMAFTEDDDNLLFRECDRMRKLENAGRGVIAAWGAFEKQHGRHSGAEWHTRFHQHVQPAMERQIRADVAQTTPLDQKKSKPLGSDIPAEDKQRLRQVQRSSPILGEPVHEQSDQEEVATTTTTPEVKLHGRPQVMQPVEQQKPYHIRRPLRAFVTPRNATIPEFTTLTRGNNTPTRVSTPILDPVEREVKSSYVPRITNKKSRSRYSLPGPGSTD